MVFLVQFLDEGSNAARARASQVALRNASPAYFALGPLTALVVFEFSAATLAERIQQRDPSMQVVCMRLANTWQSLGSTRLSQWLQAVADQF